MKNISYLRKKNKFRAGQAQRFYQKEHYEKKDLIFLFKNIIFCRDGFGLGLGKNLHGFPRYKIVGRTDEGKICEDLF